MNREMGQEKRHELVNQNNRHKNMCLLKEEIITTTIVLISATDRDHCIDDFAVSHWLLAWAQRRSIRARIEAMGM